MTTNKRQFTMRMQPQNFDKIRVIAAVNKRSVAMQIEYLMEQCIRNYEKTHGMISIYDNQDDQNIKISNLTKNGEINSSVIVQ